MRLWQYGEDMHKFKPHRSPAQIPTLKQEAVCNRYLVGMAKSLLFSVSNMGVSATFQGKAESQEQLANIKRTHGFLFAFLHVCVYVCVLEYMHMCV